MAEISKTTLSVRASAKINLSLVVRGQTESGHHFLDTIIAPINIYDSIEFSLSKEKRSKVTYSTQFNFKVDNTEKALNAISERYNLPHLNAAVEKRIPLSSGLGGSSAGIAAAAKAMEHFFGIEVQDDFLFSLGADTPAMKRGYAVRAEGMGEKVSKVDIEKQYVAIALSNKIKVDTKSCFQLYDIIGGEDGEIDSFLERGLKKPFNSLERAAMEMESGIKELKQILLNAGFNNVVMTGSGGAVCAYTSDKDEFTRLCENISEKQSGISILTAETESI